ncbi:MAG: hypothetical protein NTU64_09770 [Hyphomicrobiales bacterium]|nr:hypothetical protein [Hyphomicrobiales bacterium]
MTRSSPLRRTFSLAAVYVVVLQALLLPLAVAAGGLRGDGPCVSSSIDTHAPAGGDTGCPCAAGCGTQCCAQAVSGGTPGASVYDPSIAWRLAPVFNFEAVRQAATWYPQIPRAPPLA